MKEQSDKDPNSTVEPNRPAPAHRLKQEGVDDEPKTIGQLTNSLIQKLAKNVEGGKVVKPPSQPHSIEGRRNHEQRLKLVHVSSRPNRAIHEQQKKRRKTQIKLYLVRT